MASYSSEITGMSGGYGPAPADFGDAQESAPSGAIFDIGGHGQTAPYTIAVGNMLNKQLEEIRGKATMALAISTTWKRRFREFMSKKNNDLIDFLNVTVPSHPVFGRGEILLRRFGNPQCGPSHPSVRDMIMDVSGETTIEEVNEGMLAIGGSGPLKDLVAHTTLLYEMYKDAGEAAIAAQNALKLKLDKLDKVQGKLANLFEIDVNDKYEALMEANESYLKKVFEEAQIESDYKGLIEAYRKFITLRDVILTSKAFKSMESQPMCSICVEEPVSYTLTPCGHTFCQNCIKKHTSNSCFICRASVKDKVRLYFG
jgi:hypothetical protein